MKLVAAGQAVTRRLTPAMLGGIVIALMFLWCLGTLPWSTVRYDNQHLGDTFESPTGDYVMGTDQLGRSVAWRCALGGAVSLSIGVAAALIAVIIGTTWGLLAGYVGGRTDAFMMRAVDVLYGLPYVLLVVLLAVAVDGAVDRLESAAGEVGDGGWFGGLRRLYQNQAAVNLFTLFVAIGAVSWLTLARVVRGQVLSIKHQPFIESARAIGCRTPRILLRHVLPNLIGPIIVYTTLTVPQAILQESFLSFLGIGVQPPVPSWGNLAAEGLSELNPIKSHWWLLAFPCLLLGLTLLALNFLGDGLRDRYDPHAARR